MAAVPELSVRERFQRCLDFEPVDRVPFMEIVPGPSNPERWAAEGFPAGTDFTAFFGLDLVYAIAWVEGPDPPFPPASSLRPTNSSSRTWAPACGSSARKQGPSAASSARR